MRPAGSKRRYSDEQRAEMVRLYCEELLSLPEVARRFGCDHTTVRLWLIRAGIARRTPAEQRAALQTRLGLALNAPPPAPPVTTPEDLERVGNTLRHVRRLIEQLERTGHIDERGQAAVEAAPS